MIAALICGGETAKLSAIWGSEVEMIDELSPSMKNAPATVIGTISGTFACGGSSFAASEFSDHPKGLLPTFGRPLPQKLSPDAALKDDRRLWGESAACVKHAQWRGSV